MGSSPIPSVSPLDSSVGRARTQRQMHLVYILHPKIVVFAPKSYLYVEVRE